MLLHSKKHLSFNALKKAISSQLCQIEDPRQKGKIDYSLHDCVMSAFAMMYLQDPSLLAFQRRIQDRIQRNNLSTIFGVQNIPKDSQLRNVLDALPIEEKTNLEFSSKKSNVLFHIVMTSLGAPFKSFFLDILLFVDNFYISH